MRLRNIPGAKDAITESSYVVQMPAEWKGKWNRRFSKEQPLHIEVGMGKGRFLMDMAKLHPEINYVGIEMYDSVLLRALQKRERLEADGVKLDNLMFMCIDARLLPEIFEKGEVSRIYLNFSDPWPKARHAKRRLTYRGRLQNYKKVLNPDGFIEFKTDNEGLFAFTLEEIEACGYEMIEMSRDLHGAVQGEHGEKSRRFMTEYEEKFSGQGKNINFVRF